jgi:hypothetical protein
MPTWNETKRVLKPLNQESKKLLADGFVNEVELNKILEFKPKFEDHSKIAEVFNEAIKSHVGRRARFLEVYKKQQERWDYYLRTGIPLPNPNPGYSGPTVSTDELEETPGKVSTEPEVSMHSSSLSEPGLCSPQRCICDDDDCIWGKANYTN